MATFAPEFNTDASKMAENAQSAKKLMTTRVGQRKAPVNDAEDATLEDLDGGDAHADLLDEGSANGQTAGGGVGGSGGGVGGGVAVGGGVGT